MNYHNNLPPGVTQESLDRVNPTVLPEHNCTLIDQEYDYQCEVCEQHFWDIRAKHDDDHEGLDNFLERRAEILKDSFTSEGIRQLA